MKHFQARGNKFSSVYKFFDDIQHSVSREVCTKLRFMKCFFKDVQIFGPFTISYIMYIDACDLVGLHFKG